MEFAILPWTLVWCTSPRHQKGTFLPHHRRGRWGGRPTCPTRAGVPGVNKTSECITGILKTKRDKVRFDREKKCLSHTMKKATLLYCNCIAESPDAELYRALKSIQVETLFWLGADGWGATRRLSVVRVVTEGVMYRFISGGFVWFIYGCRCDNG